MYWSLQYEMMVSRLHGETHGFSHFWQVRRTMSQTWKPAPQAVSLRSGFWETKNIACKVNLREQKQNMFAIVYFQKNHNSWQNKCRTPAG